MGNWEYDGDEQHLHLGSSGVTPDMSYTENGEWRLTNSSGCEFVLQGPEPLPHLMVTLTVEFIFIGVQSQGSGVMRTPDYFQKLAPSE